MTGDEARIAHGSAVLVLCVALGLILGVGSPQSAPPRALSFAPTTAVVVKSASKASVLVDRGSGRFVNVKGRRAGRVAVADAIGDLNGDGRPDLVTHYNSSDDGEGITIDGVTVYPAYAYVNLSTRKGGFQGVRQVYESDYADVTSSAIGDVNGDGRPDLLIALNDYVYGRSGVLLRIGRGRGRFEHDRYRLRAPHPIAVAAADVNGDGRRDVVTANEGGTVSVFLNRGGERFAARRNLRVGAEPVALAVGDLNGDGRPDLAVARAGAGVHAITVLLNRRGSFGARRDYSTGTQPVSVAIGDLNGDRRPDLVSANGDAATVSVLFNQGGGAFRTRADYPTARFPIAAAIGKLNGDGRRDLVIPAFNGDPKDPVTVLVNTPGLCNVQDVWGLQLGTATQKLALSSCGVGTVSHAPSSGFAAGRVISQTPEGGAVLQGGAVDLTVSDGPGPGPLGAAPRFAASRSYPIPKAGQLVAVADLNGDGSADVVSGNCGNTVSVLLNRGNGRLSARKDFRVHDCPDTLALADLNGDGRPDIVVGSDGGTVSVLLNHGDGTFAARQDYYAGEGPTYGTNYVAVGDLNADGRPDLAIADGSGFSVYANNGDGTFGTKRDYGLAVGDAVAIADLNGDGSGDLVTDDGVNVRVVLNRGGGTFEVVQQASTAQTDASDIFVGDLTGDGKPDVVATSGDSIDVLLNNGAGWLRPYVEYRGASDLAWATIGDVNGDGTQDVVTAGKTVSILRDRGDGTFRAKRDYSMGTRKRPPRAVALGDLNGDGKPDLVTANGPTLVVRLHR
jgi:hypothetical protein